ncbi:hypothetical protein COMA2_110109 [Candidatus Nitrospira nitrificans]|uniref:Uncharacterized protein n=1 Tax=Candidatus Nitrospira nitrificans TaxID=1742973 RepID=A0A0S4LAM4_9BACT|nr:hypothetical protein COMA2_110109 [Candidatus Nitrospira nitrificans]
MSSSIAARNAYSDQFEFSGFPFQVRTGYLRATCNLKPLPG